MMPPHLRPLIELLWPGPSSSFLVQFFGLMPCFQASPGHPFTNAVNAFSRWKIAYSLEASASFTQTFLCTFFAWWLFVIYNLKIFEFTLFFSFKVDKISYLKYVMAAVWERLRWSHVHPLQPRGSLRLTLLLIGE